MQEQEAYQWAANKLVPQERTVDLFKIQISDDLEHFVLSINFHPGIVVERLQHEGELKYETHLNYWKE